MRRDRRKRKPIIDHEERKQALKKLGYGCLSFVVLFAVFAGKEFMKSSAPEQTASMQGTVALSSSKTSATEAFQHSNTSVPSTSHTQKSDTEWIELHAQIEAAKRSSQRKTVLTPAQSQITEDELAKSVLDER